MGVNKVDTASGEVIMDISDSTVTPETLSEGATAYNSQGIKIKGRMASDGSGLAVQVQADYEQTDSTQVDFIKNKPFGDNLPITERFSQAETPCTIAVDVTALGYTCYKIFDTAITQEQVMAGATVTTTIIEVGVSVTEALTDGTFTPFNENLIGVELPSGAGYLTVYQSCEISGVTIEKGTYFVMVTGSHLPDSLVVEISYLGTKKLDPKFLPNNIGAGVRVFEVEAGEGDDASLLQLSDEQSSEIENLIFEGDPFVLKLALNTTDAEGQEIKVSLLLQHSALGYFYSFLMGLFATSTYDATNKTLENTFDFSPVSTANTYSLRGNTQSTTFAELVEMITESARQRGLVK